MRFPLFSWLLLLYSVSVLFPIDQFLVYCRCLEDQRSLLLHLNQSLSFNLRPRPVTSKLASWNTSSDCCTWKGVTCEQGSGHVNGLDLSSEYITGGLDNSNSSLFNLRYLQSLNLANNYFNRTQIPSALIRLVNLTNLNLSKSGFAGQVPIEISYLTRLVSLDLSAFPGKTRLRLEKPDLGTFVRNLSGLKTLHLDGVNISAPGSQWCRALSSALPNLQVLSLSNCYLSGPLDSSLSELSLLSHISLSQNNISAEVPVFFKYFSNLTSLHLNSCGLKGKFPEKVLQLRNLQSLDVSQNPLLSGSLPEFSRNGSLQNLILSSTSFSGPLPDSIGNLSLLSKLQLTSCSFNGSIPSSIIQLNQLDSLDLSLNTFTGPIPPLPETLTQVNLAHNYLTGSLTDSHWERYGKLVTLDLRNNSLNGSIPSSLFTLPTLKNLKLSQNQFSGQLKEMRNMSSASLDTLDLNSNNLGGPIPLSIFELQKLNVLTLSSNNFSGTIELEMIQKLQNLTSLDLSNNSLLVSTTIHNSNSSFPQIRTLKLASCKLQGFPDFLRNQSTLSNLDLSNNQIHGQIPTWVWKIGNGSLSYLNLSFNSLNDLERPLPDPSDIASLAMLDLHSNFLQGQIPVLSSTLTYWDISNNSFQSRIPSNITSYLVFTIFFSLSSNNLSGEIPQSICNAGYLQVLDLSNNSLNGTIPSCLASISTLTVLNLRRNHFVGHIPQEFPVGCSLRTLDLSGNRLEGPLPTALANCKKLEVLNLGNNQINGSFPLYLGSCTDLRVLVLRSNKFNGPIGEEGINHNFSKLQIVDLSSNHFTGNLPTESLMKWTAMMVEEDETQSKIKHETLRVRFLNYSSQMYYQDTVTVTIKGQEMELTKILTVYTSIDLSNNGFQGEIPKVIGNLNPLYFLNLSHNALIGRIPSSLGTLKQLESLDLSSNKLGGDIPSQLISLTFLAVLNLSWNNLTGAIPMENQFRTFSATSFEGNEGLCGLPLSRKCTVNHVSPPTSTYENMGPQSDKFDWKFIFSGVGFGAGAAMAVAPLMFSKKGRKWYDKQVERIFFMIIPSAGLLCTTCDDGRVETEYNTEEELPETSEDSDDDEEGEEDEERRGKFCVFCSKLDSSRKKIVHNPNCSCHS
ncbi:receptor-like protein 7 [Macadamia integrifolia]|uniref:receptor-like protein 7 n=1 Tax=Macadamia integrifolia TaxID=60698 RepID=UPI001C4F684F|nr:receptor-like protein 7 [Macadamia integrifolia]